MKKGTLHVAVATAALMVLGASSVKAAPPALGPSNNTVDLRIVNNHASMVRVLLVDAEGKTYPLGRVPQADFRVVQISGDITAKGDVEIRIFPDEPVMSLVGDADGIHTNGLALKLGDAVNMFVETNLEDSQVEIQRG